MNDGPSGIGVSRDVLPAPHRASVQHLTLSPSSQGDVGTPGPKGDKVSPWGGGQRDGGAAVLAPLLTPTSQLRACRAIPWWWRGLPDCGAAKGSR